MDPELKVYLDEWEARQQRAFDKYMASLDGLFRVMQDTTGSVTGPVTASSDATEVAIVSAGLVEPSTTVPAIGEPLAVAPAVPTATIVLVPASCSTECAAQVITVSTTTALLPWASGSSSSSATSATNVVVSVELAPDNDGVEHGASLHNSSINVVPFSVEPAISLTARAHEDSTPSTKLVVPASTTPTFPTSIGDSSVINNSSIKGVPPAMEEALRWHQEHMHWPTPSLPPYLYLSWCASSKPRPIPWPSFAVLPGGVHLTEPRPPFQGTSGEFSVADVVIHHFFDSQSCVSPLPICLQYELDREETVTSVQHNDREDQFNSLGVSLNVSENFLKKPCAESKAAIMSGLISRGASVFKLWHNPGFSFLFLDLTSEEPYCLALFQWEIAWQPAVEGECFDIGVHYCHGNIFEGWPSGYMAMAMLLYGSYIHLKYNHHLCCWYAPKPWSPLVRMVYIYWLLTNTGFEVHSSGYAPSFLRIYLVKEENQKTPISSTDKWQLQSVACSLKPPIQWAAASYLEDSTSTDSNLAVQHDDDSLLLGVHPHSLALLQWEIAWQHDGECFDYFQRHVAWALSISSTSKDSQCIMAGLSPHDCSLGVHYCHGDIVEGIPSATRLVQSWLGPLARPKPCAHSPGSNHMQEKQVFDSAAGHVHHITLQSDGADIYQLLTHHKTMCLQPKPSLLSILIKIDTKVEKGGVHPYGEEIKHVQLLLRRAYSELPIEVCLHELHLTRRGTEAGVHFFHESTSRSLLQAPRISHNNQKMELCRAARELLILQTQGHDWIYHGVQVPWDPGGSTWCRWFSPCDNQAPFQGGRHMPVLGQHKEFRLPWDPGGVAAACDKRGIDVIAATALDQWQLGPRLSDRRLQWDPGRLSVASAWGQAEFQGGRDVRILSDTRTWADLLGHQMGWAVCQPSGAA